ncbi:hypothetical protein DL240_07260 [Lujinxingia litoralis]|uniref:Uncharacterized protein n=1 Tax=Lujinxingia litoralis TaxID=2211119 RepID=A0A328CAH0_9DELT|nr:hypothetical protein [Lujinxingia litoralis]RAL23938.1 hypothetical protein DL240_07260 [Lujinxingia litoralis]
MKIESNVGAMGGVGGEASGAGGVSLEEGGGVFEALLRGGEESGDERLEGDYYGRALEEGAVQRGEEGWAGASDGERLKRGEEPEPGAMAGEEKEGGESEAEDVRRLEEAVEGPAVSEVVRGPERPGGGVNELAAGGGGGPELGEVVEQMVRAAQVGEDAQGRRVMFLELEVPGRGMLKVRLLREHDGFSVRMRASDEGLARDLLRWKGEMVRAAGERGVKLNGVAVVC